MTIYKSNNYSLFSKFMQHIERNITGKELLIKRKYNTPKFPETMLIGQTNYCNHKCIMCPNRFIKNKGFMDMETFLRIIDEVKKYKKYVGRIGFGLFGETLLHPNIKEFIKIIREELGNIKIEIGTNAILLDDKMTDFLARYKVDQVNISFYVIDKESYSVIQGHHPNFFELLCGTLTTLLKKLVEVKSK